MIARDGSVRLLDFGLARGAGIDLTTLTRTGTILGTPGYMSPEQFDAHGVDERSDLYSLGVVLFEVLTGRLPFTGQTPIAVALAHKTRDAAAAALAAARRARLARARRAALPREGPGAALRERRRAGGGAAAAARRRPAATARPSRAGTASSSTPARRTDWALVLTSAHEKTGWSEGMALRFEDRYYRLAGAQAPAVRGRALDVSLRWPGRRARSSGASWTTSRTWPPARRPTSKKLSRAGSSRWLGRRE